MSNQSKPNCFSDLPLFGLANFMADTEEANSFKKVAAWFLGPKGENAALLERLVSASIREHADYRRTHYKRDDPPYIDKDIMASEEYQSACRALDDHRQQLSKLLQKSVPFYSLRYQAHMNWDTVLPGSVGYITAMLYNQNNVATEGGPQTCALEKEVGEQLCRLMGFSEHSWGHITADGTIANLEAMWVARNLKFYPLAIKEMLLATPALEQARHIKVRVWEGDDSTSSAGQFIERELAYQATQWQLLNLDSDQIMALPERIQTLCSLAEGDLEKYITPYLLQNKGLMYYARKYPQIVNVRVLVPATSHYSWPKSGTLLGLGRDSIVGIPVDDQCRMDINELREALRGCAISKIPVLMVVGVIGSTEEGVVDNLEGILELRNQFKGLQFLLHCDAAWGGYLRTMITAPPSVREKRLLSADGFVPVLPLSKYAKRQYELLSEADTITVDPHKAGFIPYPAGSLCYKSDKLRFLITFNAPYIHSSKELNMGIFGVEGSKPGAAAAAVWMAHKTIPLDTSGYGQILGQCSFTTKLYYCYWLTLASEKDNFRIEPLIPLPPRLYGRKGKVIAEGKQGILSYIRANIIGKSNRQLTHRDSDALAVLQQVGADVLINAFTVNFRRNGQWNHSLDQLNALNTGLLDKFSITTPEQAAQDRVDLILTSSQIDSKNYASALKRICHDLDIKAPSGDYSMGFMINTILQPWPTTHNFVHTIMDIFRKGVEECIGKLPQAGLETGRLNLAERVPDEVLRIPADDTSLPSEWYHLTNSYAGYAATAVPGNRLFYWFFECSECDPHRATPLIIWLNGGPGASSLAGLFLENGPFTLHRDGHIVPNAYSWNQEAHLLFWDQPVGTGFSYTENQQFVKSEEELAGQFVDALQDFFNRHPQYRDNPLYLTGESYAGKYIPYIGLEIAARGRRHDQLPINLKGLAIGNGWMDPELHTGDQIDYSFMLGMADTRQQEAAQKQYEDFRALIAGKHMAEAFVAGTKVSDMLVKCGGGEDIYDVRSWGDEAIIPALRKYLSSSLVKSALNVPPNQEWQFADASGPVSDNLIQDLMASMTHLLPQLADDHAGYKLLFYTGNFDMACGFTGTEKILRTMDWKGKKSWLQLPREVWYETDAATGKRTSLGSIKRYRHLMQIGIPMSGHQVPMYQPDAARKMIYNWIFDRPFTSYDPLKAQA